jgi:hypothetical protein
MTGIPPNQLEHRSMSRTEYDTAIAQFLLTKSVTRCPTVCVVPTQATVADADRAAYRDYVAAREAARLEKLKSLRHLVNPLPVPENVTR